MPEKKDIEKAARISSFWSGTITFGLVSVPVSFYSANRAKSVSLRMVDKNGIPLSRKYYCPRENRSVDGDEIVRGYDTGDENFVVVEDEELEALEPKKSNEIDLRRFVKIEEINPLYFQRSYYLAPGGDSHKAYRLLAENLERSGRAGVATFVMRGKEYMIAITSENGILQAGTLRFHDEIRSPEDIGLPESGNVSSGIINNFYEDIKSLKKKKFDETLLRDRYAQGIKDLVEKKIRSGEDIVPEEQIPGETDNGPMIIDLMEVLKHKFEESRRKKKTAQRKTKRTGRSIGSRELDRKSKSELYELAQELGIQGRSTMSKKELVQSIKRAS